MISEIRMDKENELWKYAAVRPKSHNNSILSFLAPRTGALAKAVWITTLREQCSVDSLAPSPTTDITPLPHSTASVTLCTATRASRSATGAVINGTGPDGCLPELDMFPRLQVCVYGICAFVLRCFFFFFSVLRLYSKWSIVWGLNFYFIFSPLSPHVKAVFFLIPCLPVLSTPLSYVCCVCMDRLMANFAGTCTSDNKGLLLLLKG